MSREQSPHTLEVSQSLVNLNQLFGAEHICPVVSLCQSGTLPDCVASQLLWKAFRDLGREVALRKPAGDTSLPVVVVGSIVDVGLALGRPGGRSDPSDRRSSSSSSSCHGEEPYL